MARQSEAELNRLLNPHGLEVTKVVPDEFHFYTEYEQIIADNEDVAWSVAYHTLDDARRAGEEALGRIAAFEAVITGLEEDTAFVAAPGVERAHLVLTEHIDPAAFSVEDALFFHARLNQADPLVLYLLGWEEE